ncbi:MAG: cupin domain-containing protein [Actinomycetota bacterium]
MSDAAPTSTVVVVPVSDLGPAIEFLRTNADFDLLSIHPADSPRSARLARDGTTIELQIGRPTGTVIAIAGPDLVDGDTVGPDGLTVRRSSTPSLVVHPVVEETSIGPSDHDGDHHVGRAGMTYRDLIPSRWGGAVIASSIRIESAGSVPDYVHHHDVLFQLIFCRRGWVEVVYEDQGEPFLLHAGDCVIQPPHIRHRVLSNSDGMEVVEIGYPAEHLTLVEHDLRLPNGVDHDTRWSGQSFVHHHAGNRHWIPVGTGVERTDTGVRVATNGLADVSVVRLSASASHSIDPESSLLHPRMWVLLDGSVDVDGSTSGRLLAGATLSVASTDSVTLTAVTDSTLLCVTIDASKPADHWRPRA